MPDKKTTTRSDIARRLAERFHALNQQQVNAIITALFNEVLPDMLSQNIPIRLRGFGTFSLQHRQARIGRNIHTGKPLTIPETYVPHFKPSPELKAKMRGA